MGMPNMPKPRGPMPRPPGGGTKWQNLVHHMGSGGCNMVVDIVADQASKIRQAYQKWCLKD